MATRFYPPNDSIFYYYQPPHAGEAITMTHDEKIGQSCSFIGANCVIEVPEHEAAKRAFMSGDSVIEFGARYGTTTCEIAHRIGNTGRLISVEIDPDVFDVLEKNIFSHRCNCYLVTVPIGAHPVRFSGSNYASRGLVDRHRSHDPKVKKEYYGLYEIQELLFEVDALLIDCEGCIDQIFEGLDVAHALKKIHTIVIETDMGLQAADCTQDCVDWKAWTKRLIDLGYSLVYAVDERPDLWHVIFTKRIFAVRSPIPSHFPYLN